MSWLSRAALLPLLCFLPWQEAKAHGGYDYRTAGLMYYGPHDVRASYMPGMALGLAIQAEPLRMGYTLAQDRLYLPVNSLLPLSLFALDRYGGFAQDNSGGEDRPRVSRVKQAAMLASALGGLRIGGAVSHFNLMLGHHLELYAPHPAISETLEASAFVFCVEVSLFKRFASAAPLADAGVAVGLAWDFSDLPKLTPL